MGIRGSVFVTDTLVDGQLHGVYLTSPHGADAMHESVWQVLAAHRESWSDSGRLAALLAEGIEGRALSPEAEDHEGPVLRVDTLSQRVSLHTADERDPQAGGGGWSYAEFLEVDWETLAGPEATPPRAPEPRPHRPLRSPAACVFLVTGSGDEGLTGLAFTTSEEEPASCAWQTAGAAADSETLIEVALGLWEGLETEHLASRPPQGVAAVLRLSWEERRATLHTEDDALDPESEGVAAWSFSELARVERADLQDVWPIPCALDDEWELETTAELETDLGGAQRLLSSEGHLREVVRMLASHNGIVQEAAAAEVVDAVTSALADQGYAETWIETAMHVRGRPSDKADFEDVDLEDLLPLLIAQFVAAGRLPAGTTDLPVSRTVTVEDLERPDLTEEEEELEQNDTRSAKWWRNLWPF